MPVNDAATRPGKPESRILASNRAPARICQRSRSMTDVLRHGRRAPCGAQLVCSGGHGDIMQRIKLAFAALATTALSACAHVAAAPASCPGRDKSVADVAQAMRDMYAALKTDDLKAFRVVTTRDFFAFDGGKRFDGAALMDLIKAAHDKGAVYEWHVNDPKVEVSCDVALVTYVNTGSLTEAGATRSLSWLESATLRHDGQRWLVRFFHATRVP
jgi:ketosteroid isomerase-like protein